MAVHLDACIVQRCVRACREEQQVNDVIGYAFRGGHPKIVFDFDDAMGASTCVACGECVQACPTGALMPARDVGKIVPDKQVDSVCPYCGVGCQLTYNIKNNTILSTCRGRMDLQTEPLMCKRALRLRLCSAQASAHQAADPQAGHPQAQGLRCRSRQLATGLSRGHMGRSVEAAAGDFVRPVILTASGRWPVSDPPKEPMRRHTSSRNWCERASARTTSITARVCVTPRAWQR